MVLVNPRSKDLINSSPLPQPQLSPAWHPCGQAHSTASIASQTIPAGPAQTPWPCLPDLSPSCTLQRPECAGRASDADGGRGTTNRGPGGTSCGSAPPPALSYPRQCPWPAMWAHPHHHLRPGGRRQQGEACFVWCASWRPLPLLGREQERPGPIMSCCDLITCALACLQEEQRRWRAPQPRTQMAHPLVPQALQQVGLGGWPTAAHLAGRLETSMLIALLFPCVACRHQAGRGHQRCARV